MDLVNFLVENALVIVPVLWVIGRVIKGSKTVSDKYIPLILLALGPAFAVATLGINVEAIMQGIIAAGVAVYGHQLLKQNSKKE